MLYSLSIFPYVDSSSGAGEGVPGYRELHRDRLLQQQSSASAGDSGHYTR